MAGLLRSRWAGLTLAVMAVLLSTGASAACTSGEPPHRLPALQLLGAWERLRRAWWPLA